MSRLQTTRLVLAAITLAAIVALIFVPPIAQDPSYHRFSDARTLLGIPNFWNVASNLPFALVGLYGLARLLRLAEPRTRVPYAVLCVGVIGVAFGSGSYHLTPNDDTLVWDRLPMTIAFMAFLALLLDERMLRDVRHAVLALLLAIGVGSVLYWQATNDLRPYALVQFLPMLLVPVILVMRPAQYLSTRWIVASLAGYVVAKILEHFDAPIHAAIGFTGGHALKHVAAAGAVLCIVLAVRVRPVR